MYRLSIAELMLLAICLLFSLFYYRVAQFLPMLKRMRWLMMSMFLIYAFSTPGEYLNDWPIQMSPTYEGVEDGVIQCLRLSMMLAAVALLIASTSKESMILGFYCLLKPLKYMGFKPEKFAARLSLTLYYIELNNANHDHATYQNKQAMKWQGLMRLDQESIDYSKLEPVITLQEQSLSVDDCLLMLIVLVLVIVKWLV